MWGWALLGSKTHGRDWHKVRAVQNYGKANWARHLTACGLTIAGTEVETGTQPATGSPVCRECEATAD